MNSKHETLMRLMNEVYASRDAGNIPMAISKMLELLQIQPDWEHGGGWFELAGFYLESLQFSEAANSYEKGLSFPGHDDSLQNFLYSEALAGCGRLDESFERLKKAILCALEFDGQRSTLSIYSIKSILDISNYWAQWNGKLFNRLKIHFPELAYLWKDIEEGVLELPELETWEECRKRYLGVVDREHQ